MFSDYKAFIRENFFPIVLVFLLAFLTVWGILSGDVYAHSVTLPK